MVLTPLLLALACSSAPDAPASGAETPVVVGSDAARAALPPAPTRAWQGLGLGVSDDAAITAWLRERVPGCAGAPSPMRASFQYRCAEGLTPALLEGRTVRGRVASLLLARPEAGVLHHVSTLRQYTLPADAVADFASALAALTAQLGPPAAGGRPLERAEQLDARFGRWFHEWRFGDLEVRLTAARTGKDYTSVTEIWEVPGVTEAIASRPGVSGHGGAAATNPHVAEVASSEVANVAPARVEEVARADGAVYARVREAQWDYWVRLPEQPVAVGDHVLLGRGPERRDVEVPALGRTLETIIELAGAQVVTEAEARARTQVAPVDGGLRIADVFERRDALAGSTVKVRGRVVKASKGVFGTNWYHLQDGSGSASAGTHDLTVTADAEFEVGQVVVAEGPLTKDKDLGFGYFYTAILEDARVAPAP